MKIETTKERIEEVLSKAQKATGKNLSLLVLSCVLLEAKEGSLTIRATNLELGVEFTVSVRVVEEGVVAIPAQTLTTFITNLPKEEKVLLEADNDSTVVVKTTSTSTKIKTLPKDDFPSLPTVEKKTSLTIQNHLFIEGLRSVWFSASNSNIKPELASVYLYTKDNKVFFVSTDSFRLAEKSVKKEKGSEIESVLIPYKNIPEMIRAIEGGGEKEELEIDIDSNQLSISKEGMYLTSRLIDGSFPDYKQIIPSEFVTEVTVLKDDILNALKIGNTFIDEFKQITFSIDPSKKTVSITSKNVHIGESVVDIKGAVEGQEIGVSFNHKYILDVFQSIVSDSISLQFAGKGAPLVMKGVNDPSFLYLVMPMSK